MSGLGFLLAAAFSLVLAGAAGLTFRLTMTPAAPKPTLGTRGLKRRRALSRPGPFALAEPVVRSVATWVSGLRVPNLRRRLRRALNRAGDHLGFSDDELIAACLLCGTTLGLLSFLLCQVLALSPALSVIVVCLGTLVPWLRILSVARTRARSIDRMLPGAVELAAMCMGAGLDFPGSLREIVDSAADPNEPIIEEFGRILRELELGHTRRRVLGGLAERVPTPPVREFVSSVAQAENKGTPLAKVLTIQAQTQRLRRSIAAEQTASSAALMLLGPMTLIFLCVIVLLLGPVVVRFMTGGLGP